MLRIVIPLLFAVGVYSAVDEVVVFPASISATRGHGQPGTAVATDVDCGEDSCYVLGDYISADRTITYHDIGLHGRGWQEGKPVAALYEGRSLSGPLVFRAGDHFAWALEVLPLVVGFALAIGMPVLGVLAIRGRLE
jgi:hypothetical protein